MLIHGLGSTWRAWRPVFPLLEPAFDVLAVDMPGFGCSPALPDATPPTPEALADSVEREMDLADFDTAHVAGNSLGGRVGAELARRGRARTAVLFSPAGLATPAEQRYAEAQLHAAFFLSRHAKGQDVLLRLPPLRILFGSLMNGRPRRLSADWLIEQSKMLAGSTGFTATMRRSHSTTPRGLDEIDVPVLVAWGTRDRLLLPRQGKRWVKAIPDAELRYLDGLGHVPMPDDPELVAETIRSWTSRPAAAPA